jgi:alanyl-tRNA synthetase
MDDMKEILDEEEESFSRTLDRGEKLFDLYTQEARTRGVKELNGKDVWRLYDTFGFPVDLTRLMAEELGLGINDKEFEEAQALSKEASKARIKKKASDVVKLDVHDLGALEKDEGVQKTDDSAKFSKQIWMILEFCTHFTFLDVGTISAIIKAIFYNKAFFQSTSDIPLDTTFGLLLDRTSFYAESGGQEYDTGNIVLDGVADFEVTNVQVYNGYVLHTGRLKYGELNVGDEVVSSYDEVRSTQSAISSC